MAPPDETPTSGTEETPDSALPGPTRTGHAKMPEHLDDDQLARAAARERVDAGIDDYVPEDVPPAADPLPEGSSEAADLAQRGVLGDTTAPDEGA